jgi:uncharacterized membrane protein YqjE
MLSKKRMHQLITAIPGLFVVVVLFLVRQIELAMVILVFDIIGAIGGIWWLHFSKKLADKLHSANYSKGGLIASKPVRIVLVIFVIAVALAAVWGIATVMKSIVPHLIDPKCIEQIHQQTWIEYGECLNSGRTCTNPILMCGR